MFGGPDKGQEIDPLYQTVDPQDVTERAEAAETAGARERRIQAEARVVTQPDDFCGDGEIIDADERELAAEQEQGQEREIRADGGRVPYEGHSCPNCGERGAIQEFATSSWWECPNGHVFDFSGLVVDEDAEVTKIVTDGGSRTDDTGRDGEVVPIRKKDTSESTKDYWRNGAGDHPYHRDDEPCDDAPEHGYMMYESDEIHSLEGVDVCPNCDWSGTDLEGCANSESDSGTLVTDGGELPEIHLGDHVIDREADDGPKMLVVEISPTRAGDYELEGIDETVASYNDCDAEELVYEVTYLDRCDVSLESIDRFAFPRSRLELAQPLHERDGDQDDSGGDDE